MRSRSIRALRLALLLGAMTPTAPAGGGPETTVVVVNGGSPASIQLARDYTSLRGIDPSHVIVLDRVPGAGPSSARRVELDECIEQILRPVVEEISTRGLAELVDTVAFSSGFPHSVHFAGLARERELPQAITPTASLTGLGFHARALVDGDFSGLSLEAQPYFQPAPAVGAPAPALRSRGFEPSATGPLLCCFLAYVGQRGNTEAEARRQLRRSVEADGSRPEGTVYLMENGDVRARTRMPLFDRTVQELRARGRSVEILRAGQDGGDGVLPRGRDDVLGVVVGKAGFDWAKSGSRMIPGALAESLTSFGAHFHTASQTKLTAFLAAGAAGSSGTVAEPYAIQAKFPTPLLHVFFADGCTLAEAFYQSVQSPYQLLIVGDPLTRPFASLPPTELEVADARGPRRLEDGVTLTGECRVQADPPAAPGEGLELWIDGQRLARVEGSAPLVWDTRTALDGDHHLRVVRVGAGAVRERRGSRCLVRVDNHGAVVVSLDEERPAGSTAVLELGDRQLESLRLIREDGARFEGRRRGRGFRFELPGVGVAPGVETIELRARTRDGVESRGIGRLRWVDPVLPAESEEAGWRASAIRVQEAGGDAVLWCRDWAAIPGALRSLGAPAEIEAECALPAGSVELGFEHDGDLSFGLAEDARIRADHGSWRAYRGGRWSVEAGWHRLRGTAAPSLTVLQSTVHRGDGGLDPLRWRSPELGLESFDGISIEPPSHASLIARPRADQGIALDAEGVVLRWSGSRRVAAIGLVGRPEDRGRAWPSEPQVEISSDGRRFRPVSRLELEPGFASESTGAFALLRFAPTRARALRLRLPAKHGRLREIEVLAVSR